MTSSARRVLLVGQPNVGKSSLLRALTGASVDVSNYPGTTVELYKARSTINGVTYEFIDTPGAYNLYPSSLEEEVTERALLEEDYDFVIVVIDATAIERGLMFLVAVAELEVPMIVAVNFWEEAERKGVKIDYEGLERAIGVPFVRINPIRKGGVKELVERLGEARKPRVRVRYDDHIEAAIARAETCIPESIRLSRRGLAVRLVEGDKVVWGKFGCRAAQAAREELLKSGHDPHEDIEVTRAGYALQLARRYVGITVTSIERSLFDKLVFSNPLVGLLFTATLLSALIALVIAGGSKIIGVVDSAVGGRVEGLASSLEGRGLLGVIASKVLTAVYAQYVAALPYVFLFYIMLVALEDTGLLARAMVWLHGLTKKLGIHGKGIIPALLGLGCSVPAVTSTRILPSLGQRLAVLAMLAFIPCSSRASTIFGVAGRYVGASVVLAVYAVGFLLAFAVAAVAARLMGASSDAVLVEDIPPLRRPLPASVALKAWVKLKDFIIIVTPLVAGGAALYALLDYYGVADLLASILKPLAAVMGLPPQTIIPLVYGFIQKDLVISMLAASLGTTEFSRALTPHQLVAFTLASTYQVPCIIALGAIAREVGVKRAITLLASLDAIGFGVAVLYAHLPLPPQP